LLDHVDLLKRFPRMGTVTRKRSPMRRLVHAPILVYYQINWSTTRSMRLRAWWRFCTSGTDRASRRDSESVKLSNSIAKLLPAECYGR
jgi:hypothetical protein